MKIQDPEDLFNELNIKFEYDCGIHRGRAVRYLSEIGVFQVGERDFDRWANSVEQEFDLLMPKGQRAFLRWAK